MVYFPGTPDNDTFTGGDGNDEIKGLGGNDVLAGGGGLDTLFGGDGHDWIDGGSDADTMGGGLGDDTFEVDSVFDTVLEGASQGVDLVRASVSFSLAGGQIEYLTLTGDGHINATGNGFNNLIIGNSGHNVLDGGTGADILQGGAGDDSYYVDHVNDNVVENHFQGTDVIYAHVSYTLFGRAVENLTLVGMGNTTATGNSLNNILIGNTGNNLLDGGDGRDVLDGGAGRDILRGGVGHDTYYVDDIGDNVVENHFEGSDTIYSSVSYTLFGRAVEHLILTGTDDTTATGNSLNNRLTGNGGHNVIDGAGGNDTLAGGFGDDTYYINAAGDVVTELDFQGHDRVYAGVTYAAGYEVEDVVLTGGGHFTVTGNRLDNVLTGNAGNNVLNGGVGLDTLAGGLGNDTYYDYGGEDVLIEADGEGIDTVITTSDWVLGDHIENLSLGGGAALRGTGNGLNNVLTGNSGANVLTGGLGDDTYVVQSAADTVVEIDGEGTDTVVAHFNLIVNNVTIERWMLGGTADLSATGSERDDDITGNTGANAIDGGAGADTMAGGRGNDIFIVDNGGDQVVEELRHGFDTVLSSISYVLPGGYVEALYLQGSGDIDATGNFMDNTIAGNAGANRLAGGTGNDSLTGGSGADVFVFDVASGIDWIVDFSAVDGDGIDVSAYTDGVENAPIVSQVGGDVVIDLGGGNSVLVASALVPDVLDHIVW